MELDFSELEKGLQEGLDKVADGSGLQLPGAPVGTMSVDSSPPTPVPTQFPAMSMGQGGGFAAGVADNGIKPAIAPMDFSFLRPVVGRTAYNAASAVGTGAKVVGKAMGAVGDGLDFANDAMEKGFWPAAFSRMPQVVQNGYNTADKAIRGAVGDNVGKYVIPALGAAGALGLGSMLFGGNKNRFGKGGKGGANVTVNVNGGGGAQRPGFFNQTGINSLSDPNFGDGYEKSADVVTSALANAVKNRLANKVLDAATPQAQHQPAQEKALEISSKYPEMAKLLKDEKNKEYLAHLLQA